MDTVSIIHTLSAERSEAGSGIALAFFGQEINEVSNASCLWLYELFFYIAD